MRMRDFLKEVSDVAKENPQKPLCVEVPLQADLNFMYPPRLGIREIQFCDGNDGSFMFVIHATKHDACPPIGLVENYLIKKFAANALKTYDSVEMIVNVHGYNIMPHPVSINGQQLLQCSNKMLFFIKECKNEPLTFVIRVIDKTGAPGSQGI